MPRRPLIALATDAVFAAALVPKVFSSGGVDVGDRANASCGKK